MKYQRYLKEDVAHELPGGYAYMLNDTPVYSLSELYEQLKSKGNR